MQHSSLIINHEEDLLRNLMFYFDEATNRIELLIENKIEKIA